MAIASDFEYKVNFTKGRNVEFSCFACLLIQVLFSFSFPTSLICLFSLLILPFYSVAPKKMKSFLTRLVRQRQICNHSNEKMTQFIMSDSIITRRCDLLQNYTKAVGMKSPPPHKKDQNTNLQ